LWPVVTVSIYGSSSGLSTKDTVDNTTVSATRGILIAPTIDTSITDVGLTKKNVSVLDSAAQTEISENSSAKIENHNLQSTSKSTLWQVHEVLSTASHSNTTAANERIAIHGNFP